MGVTIIDDKNMRGIIAPATTLSREVLEDMIDLMELATPVALRKTATRLRTKRGWTPLAKIARKR
ncbi:MAG: hypothetical protein AAB955_00760 [Patescibacteria group bacterium]